MTAPHPLATLLRVAEDGYLADLARALPDDELAGLLREQRDDELVRLATAAQARAVEAAPAPEPERDPRGAVTDSDVLEAVRQCEPKPTLGALANIIGHDRGLVNALRRLVRQDLLRVSGRGRGAVYAFPVAEQGSEGP